MQEKHFLLITVMRWWLHPYSMQMAKIFENTSDKQTMIINSSRFAKGMYVIRAIGDKDVLTQTFIKQ